MAVCFKNLHPHESHGLKDVIRWKLATMGRKIDACTRPIHSHRAVSKAPFSATWIGHSSFLCRLAGVGFLADPVLSDYCSPVPVERLRRRAPPGITWDDARAVGVVLITHNHYDHLDRATIKGLPSDALYIVPKGLGRWFRALGRGNVREFDWWESGLAAGLDVCCVPAQHFSSRTLWDRDRTLWAGWIVRAGGKAVYLAGDTGYCPVFREIGERCGPVDLAVIPIGAYEPRWFMQPMHVDPEEAVLIHQDVRSKLSVASHWGTFCLTDEPMDEPPRRLRAALAAAHVDPSTFRVLEIGETVEF